MLRLPDAWIWDFWFADTGAEYHVFFLRASRALRDPMRRHRWASVGHAVSTDLRTWTLMPDALAPSDGPAWDDLAIWTGSVLRGPDGTWRMFYTALSRADGGAVQRIGIATSTDLIGWDAAAAPSVVSDPRWYEQLSSGVRDHEAWRDPWVFPDPAADGWHMLITARAAEGALPDRGVVGHAWSADLARWEVRPPRSRPGAGFTHLEVTQTAKVDGRAVLLFSCLASDAAPARRQTSPHGGVWAVACDSPVGPFDVGRATAVLDDSFYVGRLVQDRRGEWQLLAFHNREDDNGFDGRLSDPMPVRWRDGALTVAATQPGQRRVAVLPR